MAKVRVMICAANQPMHRMSAPPGQLKRGGFIEQAVSFVALPPALIGDLSVSPPDALAL